MTRYILTLLAIFMFPQMVEAQGVPPENQVVQFESASDSRPVPVSNPATFSMQGAENYVYVVEFDTEANRKAFSANHEELIGLGKWGKYVFPVTQLNQFYKAMINAAGYLWYEHDAQFELPPVKFEVSPLPSMAVPEKIVSGGIGDNKGCLLYTSPSPRDLSTSRMPSSA